MGWSTNVKSYKWLMLEGRLSVLKVLNGYVADLNMGNLIDYDGGFWNMDKLRFIFARGPFYKIST